MSRKVGVPMRRLLIAAAILPMHGQPAKALLLWNWTYSGTGVSASGTFTTNDAADEAGFYQIVVITGADNGATITGPSRRARRSLGMSRMRLITW